jgi:hypothetical protein
MEVLIGKSSINQEFFIAMVQYQKVSWVLENVKKGHALDAL